jgi:hypothetical protein
MEQKTPDKNLIAFCGLYCGECGRYKDGKCPGCKENKKAGWCKVRTCCLTNGKASCADCQDFATASDCKKFNNIFSKCFAIMFGSNRQACIDMIKEKGYDGFTEEMTKLGKHSLKK